MKRLFVLILTLCCALVCVSAEAAEYGIQDLSAVWTDAAYGKKCTATYTREGVSYEMVLLGTEDCLSDSELLSALILFSEGKSSFITSPGFVDAEKESRLFPRETGSEETWVDVDGVRGTCPWGDCNACWAASVANMLTITGWAAQAGFQDEDALFSWYANAFPDNGGYQWDGITYFMNGTTGETWPIDEFGGYLPDTDTGKYLEKIMLSNMADEVDPDAFDKLSDALLCIRSGAVVGINVDCSYAHYALLSDPEKQVSYENGTYNDYPLQIVSKSDPSLSLCTFTFDGDGNIVLVTEKDGVYYDAEGNAVDTLWVKHDTLYAEDGRYYMTSEFDEETYEIDRTVRYKADAVDLSSRTVDRTTLVGVGGHAITVCGYVRDLSSGEFKGFFILDSDNDANVYPFSPSFVVREERPNRVLLCPVEVLAISAGKTFCISGYIDGEAIIGSATLLMPESDQN